jgi:hypothetical protein
VRKFEGEGVRLVEPGDPVFVEHAGKSSLDPMREDLLA